MTFKMRVLQCISAYAEITENAHWIDEQAKTSVIPAKAGTHCNG